MAADAASSSAVIAGRSHTSTRPVSSCRVSSANRLGHFGPVGAAEASAWEAGGDTGPAARRCSHARCRHPDPHQCGTRPRAATTTSLPHHHIRPHVPAHATVHPGHLPLTVPTTTPGTSTPLALRCQPPPVETSVRNQEGCRWTSKCVGAAAGRCTGPGGPPSPLVLPSLAPRRLRRTPGRCIRGHRRPGRAAGNRPRTQPRRMRGPSTGLPPSLPGSPQRPHHPRRHRTTGHRSPHRHPHRPGTTKVKLRGAPPVRRPLLGGHDFASFVAALALLLAEPRKVFTTPCQSRAPYEEAKVAKLCKPIIIGSEFCLQASSEGSPRASYCRYIYPLEEATHCCRPCCRVSDLEYLYGSFLQWQWHAPAITNPALCPVPLRWHRSHHRTEQVFSDSGARRRAGDTSETPWWGRAAAAGVDLWRALPHVRQSLAASRQSGGYRCGIGRVRRG